MTIDGGTGRRDLTFAWDGVSGVAGYHVLQSNVAPFDAGVELSVRTSGETSATYVDGVANTPDLTFFQVRPINACNHEGP